MLAEDSSFAGHAHNGPPEAQTSLHIVFAFLSPKGPKFKVPKTEACGLWDLDFNKYMAFG